MDDSKEKEKTILVVSAPIGSGHVQAAEAVARVLSASGKIKVQTANIFDFFPQWAGKLLLSAYLWLLRLYPPGYDFLYKWGDKQDSLGFRSLVNRLFALGADNFIKKTQPDLVVATHVTPAGVVALYKQKYGKKLPLVGIVTDYAMHKWWIYKEIDVYVVADVDILAGYEKDIQPGQEVWPFGIPVRQQFCEKGDITAVREKLALPEDAIVCILTGGGEGLLPMCDILKAWHMRDKTKQIFFVAVCGRNSCLEKQLLQFKYDNLRVLGFIDNMADYMQAADVVVSKAGGVTATETLAAGKRLIIYRPLPGQELINAAYLGSRELAEVAKDLPDLCSKLEVFSPKDASCRGESGKYFTAAEKIAGKLEEYLHRQ